MRKRTILPILAILALLLLTPATARAGVRIGVYLGGPPVVAVPPPIYPGPYCNPYYTYPPAYCYDYGYALPAPYYGRYRYHAPRYYSPHYYSPHFRAHRRPEFREHERHESRGRGRGGRRR